MDIFTLKRPNLEAILSALLKNLKVKVTSWSAESCLAEHPGYPSVLALSDCLQNWDVKNQTYRIDKTDFETGELLFPFAAHFTEQGGRFILVHNIDQDSVYYTDEDREQDTMPRQEFLDRWDGIAFHAERSPTSGEKSYRRNYLKGILQKMLLPLAIVLCAAIFGLAVAAHPFSPSYLSLCLIKLIGAGISILLLAQSVNSQNPFIRNLCGLAGKSDCNSILKSEAAKINGWLSWSEIGFFYFTGSLLVLLVQPNLVKLTAWLNLIALPYTIYSISYQYRHKNWCILCCAVQFILWSEFAANIGFDTFNQSSTTHSLYFIPILLLTPVIAWFLLKPIIYLSVQVSPLKQDLKGFKFDADLFMQRLISQPRYSVSDELMPVNLGSPSAAITITIVSNPYCNPCAKAHEFLDEWIARRDDIRGKVLFTTNGSEHDFRTKVARHLVALSLESGNNRSDDALKHWYHKKNTYESWALQYPVNIGEQDKTAIEKQREWCNMADISFTPTIFINGYKLPRGYELEDLQYLL